jgi:hypothetical protein
MLMTWQKLSKVEVGTGRYADGEWRTVDDEVQTTLEVRSNGMDYKMTITPATAESGYETLARLAVVALNSVKPR